MTHSTRRLLNRLSSAKLVDLCIKWTSSAKATPYLATNRSGLEQEEEDYFYEPALSKRHLRLFYLEKCKEGVDLTSLSKKELIDRIIEGDWRRGLSLAQLADIDFALLDENSLNLKWSALELVPLRNDEHNDCDLHPAKRRKITSQIGQRDVARYPSTSPATFARKLKEHVSPLVKMHCQTHRTKNPDLSVIRLQIVPKTPFTPISSNISRYSHQSAAPVCTLYIALPDSCPYVYVSIPSIPASARRDKHDQTASTASIKRIVLEAIPKAFSLPQQRWSLSSSDLIMKNLAAVVAIRGSERIATTGGAFSVLSESCSRTRAAQSINVCTSSSPATIVPPEGKILNPDHAEVESRFGAMVGVNHVPVDRFSVAFQNIFVATRATGGKRKLPLEEDTYQEDSPMSLTASGSDVFAGLKQLALHFPNHIDLGRLPASLTGQRGTSIVTL